MSRNIDEEFIKEFRELVKTLQNTNLNMTIQNLPLPANMGKEVFLEGLKNVTAKDITEDDFSKLNGTRMFLTGKRKLEKRLYNADGTFRTDKNRNYEIDYISVPHNAVAVYSQTNIALKNTTINRVGKKVKRELPEGFKYVDFVETELGRFYIYILPRKNLFILNTLSLVLSDRKRKMFFKGVSMVMKNGSTMYLYILPSHERNKIAFGSKVLKTGTNLKELEIDFANMLKYLNNNKYTFNFQLTALEEPIRGISNIGISEIAPTLFIEDFEPFGDDLTTKTSNGLQHD